MSNIVLSVENLSKQYRLGEVGTGTISHDLNRWWAKMRGQEDPFSRVGQINDRTQTAKSTYVDVLKDINFEVKQGESVGIIGGNGAGKSTLLKLISRITAPSAGTIKVKGRIAALLEVGTGMHNEMTARENIYLNGAILGMTKREITAKFDEIIDFAGCAMFVDTPVKRFSSGMRVRLGFAVAAFLEPEILIIDEVLAVGDAEFQKKAIGKMQEVSAGEGRTILFVSHNMAAVNQICNRAIVLDRGGVAFDGSSNDGIAKYVQLSNHSDTSIDLAILNKRGGSGEIRFTKIEILNSDGVESSIFFQGDSIKIVLDYEVRSPDLDLSSIHFALGVTDIYGEDVFYHQNLLIGKSFSDESIRKHNQIVFHLRNLPISKGNYTINCDIVHVDSIIDKVDQVAQIVVEDGLVYNCVKPITFGKLVVDADWTLQ